MTRILLGIALLLVCGVSGAKDLVTKSGKTYKDYEVDKATATGLSIFHKGGVATIPYVDLPDDLRKKYAKQEKEAPAKLKAARLKALDNRINQYLQKQMDSFFIFYDCKILQIIDKNSALVIPQKLHISTKPDAIKFTQTIFITGFDASSYADGERLYDSALMKRIKTSDRLVRTWNIGTYQYSSVSGAARTIQKFTMDYDEALQYLKDELEQESKKNK